MSNNLKGLCNFKRPFHICVPKRFLRTKGILGSSSQKKTFLKSPFFSRKRQTHTSCTKKLFSLVESPLKCTSYLIMRKGKENSFTNQVVQSPELQELWKFWRAENQNNSKTKNNNSNYHKKKKDQRKSRIRSDEIKVNGRTWDKARGENEAILNTKQC